MGARRWLLPGALLSAVAACTLLEGLSAVPTPIEGGTLDASPDGSPDVSQSDARAEHHPGPEAAADHSAPPPVPTAIATAQENPIGIVVALPAVFWVNNVPDGSVMSVAASGHAKPVVLAAKQLSPFSLVVQPPLIYFSREDEAIAIETVLVDGGSLTVFASGTNSSQRWLAKNGKSDLYWSNVGLDQLIDFVPGPEGGTVPIVSGLASPSQLVVDTDALYWVDQGSGTVMSAGLKGADASVIATGGAGPTYVAIDANYAYWTATTAGEVRRVPKTGGPTKLIASGEGGPTGIAVDSQYVYWADESGGLIRRAPIGGGPAVTIADKQKEPTAIAVADGVVYWTNVGDGTVMKLVP
jgi:hypothetical protein